MVPITLWSPQKGCQYVRRSQFLGHLHNLLCFNGRRLYICSMSLANRDFAASTDSLFSSAQCSQATPFLYPLCFLIMSFYHTRSAMQIMLCFSNCIIRPRFPSCALSAGVAPLLSPCCTRRDSLKGILRRFPDRLRLELDLVSEKFVVYPNQEAMLLPSSY